MAAATAGWAIRFYERHGFVLVSPQRKTELLRRYWTIPDRQVETSVVLALPHGSYAAELEFYVKEIGIAPLDVLRWATRNGAEAMGHGHELGHVAPGKLADLVVVDGDPSVDIAVLKDAGKIRAVLKGGRFVRNTLGA